MAAAAARPRASDALFLVAVGEGNVREAQRLLALDGAQVSATNANGSSGLHICAVTGDTAMARFLVSAGADLDARELPELGGSTPLLLAIAHGADDVAELLVESGADLGAAEVDAGLTPLHLCAKFGRLITARLLVARGADVHRADATGVNASFLARAAGHAAFLDIPGIPPPAAPSVEELVVHHMLKHQAAVALGAKALLPAPKKAAPAKKKK